MCLLWAELPPPSSGMSDLGVTELAQPESERAPNFLLPPPQFLKVKTSLGNNCSAKSRGKLQGHVLQSNPSAIGPRLSAVPSAPWLYRLTDGASCLREATECPWAEGPLRKVRPPEEVECLPQSPLGVSWFMSCLNPAPAGAHREPCVTNAQ